ncbi:hypothetical protein DRN67_03715 [Candidatus Micrarchaeota archaeon]|nr:MAG: hypothetical protein DRN67_03715 [Candidatus Micrarchaeota archaeon]
MVKRAQAAMEYLSTYGWAILVLVIVLAALLWLGIFNVGSRVPDQCSFPPGLTCESARFLAIDDSPPAYNGVNLREIKVTNHLGETIYICYAECRTGDHAENAITAADCKTNGIRVKVEDSLTITNLAQFGGGAPSDPSIWCLLEDTNNRMQGAPGDLIQTNVFLHYIRASDSAVGNARVIRASVIARGE